MVDIEISKLLEFSDRFPRPKWNKIAKLIETYPQSDRRDLWQSVCVSWLAELGNVLGKAYQLHESDHFVLLTRQQQKNSKLLLKTLEGARTWMFGNLEGIVSDDAHWKNVVLIFHSPDDYYNYISSYYPDAGEFTLSAGVFLEDGYKHFAFLQDEIDRAEVVAVHEYSHACLSHLPLPAWVNEGMAVAIEAEIIGLHHMRFDSEAMERHRSLWNEATIQDFWSGASFHKQEENHLSYDLGYLCVRVLAQEYTAFRGFVLEADARDGGEAAARKHYSAGLGSLMSQILGEGDWSPKPDQWDRDRKNSSPPVPAESGITLRRPPGTRFLKKAGPLRQKLQTGWRWSERRGKNEPRADVTP